MVCNSGSKIKEQGRIQGVQRVPWNPPFERAPLTGDTLIEQSTLRYSNRAVTVFLRVAV